MFQLGCHFWDDWTHFRWCVLFEDSGVGVGVGGKHKIRIMCDFFLFFFDLQKQKKFIKLENIKYKRFRGPNQDAKESIQEKTKPLTTCHTPLSNL